MSIAVKTTIFAITSILIGSFASNARAAVISFDDAYAVLGDAGNPDSFYTSQGVTIFGTYFGLAGGVGNGDPGNWHLEGTNGAAFLAINQGTSGSPTFSFDTPITAGSLDLGVSFRMTIVLQVTGFLGESQVFQEQVSISDDNENDEGTWETFQFSTPVDKLVVQKVGGDFAAFGYGIDNVVAVPEPSATALLIGAFAFASARRRTRKPSR